MGEITRHIKPAQSNQDALISRQTGLKKGPVSKGTYQDAERIAAHPEILDRVIVTNCDNRQVSFKCMGENHLNNVHQVANCY